MSIFRCMLSFALAVIRFPLAHGECVRSIFRCKLSYVLAVIRSPMAGGMCDVHSLLQAVMCLSGDPLSNVIFIFRCKLSPVLAAICFSMNLHRLK